MEVNASLAQSIFERNPNPFYLEESYTMAWMYPYLEPAGLIMRLQHEPIETWGAQTHRDRDFWDWMTRRLTSRSAYRRDFAAKKSFSKLRSSLAGLYAYRQDIRAAERAFYDALRLYPASSESVFRLIQEYYLPYGHFDTALRLLRRYQTMDPKNVKVKRIEARILVLKETFDCFNTLSTKVEQGTITTQERCELAQVCEALGLKEQAVNYWMTVTEAPDLTARGAGEGVIALQRLRAFDAALTLLKRTTESVWHEFTETELLASASMAQSYGEMALAFSLYRVALAKAPQSGRVWLGIALYYYNIGNEANAYECMCTAVRNGASSLIREDAAIADVFLRLMQRYGTLRGGM
jgi:tetratricopeptide (TPR) repeat protein